MNKNQGVLDNVVELLIQNIPKQALVNFVSQAYRAKFNDAMRQMAESSYERMVAAGIGGFPGHSPIKPENQFIVQLYKRIEHLIPEEYIGLGIKQAKEEGSKPVRYDKLTKRVYA